MDETIPITRPQSAPANPTKMPDAVRHAYAVSIGESTKRALPTFSVELPSKGYFYPENNPLSTGTVDLYEVTARHEDILSNTTLLKKGTVLDEFLKAVIATPGVSLDDLIIGDKNAIIFAARVSAYGNMYKAKTKCSACEKEVFPVIDLNTVTAKEFDFSNVTRGQNQFSFVLPHSQKMVMWKVLTHKDETLIDTELKNLAKLSSGASSPEITTRLKYSIISIDGKTDRSFIKNYVDTELSAKDSLAFRKNAMEFMPDLHSTYEFECPNCGREATLPIPLGASFFWPGVAD